ncbi:MAG: NAD(P)-dependent oxidoreductase [Acidobacteriaceae bacterium]|nr:NAD(P)-dependent oxidoreductase [Acidobacteriaceae bacterium]MBV9781472.1 NAD(P)-dependent oxidoreductase [Acidobacteriaceae bacterium]
MKIGYIGLGKMGSGIARNLLRAGHELIVFNRTGEKAEALAGEGAHIAGSLGEACREREAVMTMLADDPAVAGVVFGEHGIASSLEPESVHISQSTISTRLAKQLASEHRNRGHEFVSAPVFGRPEIAEAGKLVVVVAGDRKTVERCRPLFDAIGRATFIAGSEPWQANAVKLCGNFMIASMIEAFSEAYATLRKCAVDHHLFREVMNELFGSPIYKNYGRIVADQEFDPPGFTLMLGLKDIRLVLEAAEDVNAPMPLASVIRNHMISGVAQGQEDLDWSSIARVLARNAGLEN